jgi:c-di-GMP-binding flagellar brake protein YcgR
MAERRKRWDRRREPRSATAGRATWTKRTCKTTFRGWLSDISRSGASFIAATAQQPSLGEEIQIIDSDRSKQRCRVMRIAPYDDYLSLIACRKVASDESCMTPPQQR